MGWYAETSWTLEVPEENIAPLAAELRAVDGLWTQWNPAPDDDRACVGAALFWHDECSSDWDGNTLAAWGSGNHSHDYGTDLGVNDILAKYVTGTADWVGESDYRWRVRYYGNGVWKQYDGEIVYPEDSEEPPTAPYTVVGEWPDSGQSYVGWFSGTSVQHVLDQLHDGIHPQAIFSGELTAIWTFDDSSSVRVTP